MEKMNLKKISSEIREYVKTRILYLKEKNYSVKDIGNLLNIHDDYVYQVLKKYRENGNKLPPEKIRDRKTGEKRRLSPEQESEIKSAITEHTPDYWKLPYSLWSREAIQELIDKKYGFKMPLTTITEYLKRWSMTGQRPAKRATKQNAAAVKEFQEGTFTQIVTKAKKEHGIIFFGDETGICNQENYQRGFSPAGVASVVKLPVKKEKINMISIISRQGTLQIYVLFRHFDAVTSD